MAEQQVRDWTEYRTRDTLSIGVGSEMTDKQNKIETEYNGDQKYCQECESKIELVISDGEKYCPNCGAVVDDKQLGSESDHVPSPNKVENSGESIFTKTGGQGSQIDIDSTSETLSEGQKDRSVRLKLWNQRFKNRGEEIPDQAFTEIKRMGSALDVDDKTCSHAAIIYTRAREEGIQMRRSVEQVATAALYLAIKDAEIPKPVSEITQVARTEKREILRVARAIGQKLDFKIEPTEPEDYLSRYASALGLGMDAQAQAKEWIESSQDELGGYSPTNVAAAALYAASLVDPKANLSQSDVVEETEISSKRLSELYTQLYER